MSVEDINSKFDISFPSNKEMKVPVVIGPYTVTKLIMETSNSVVLSSYDRRTSKKVAIKCIPIQYFVFNPSQVKISESVQDPRIIKILDSFLYPEQNPRFFAIVMERFTTDLLEYVILNEHLPEQIVCKIMRDILEAVVILHSNNIWHRNLKPDNILLKEEQNGPSIAITDFFHSIVVPTPTFNGQVEGTLQYAAPELLEISDKNLFLKKTAECLS